MIKGDIHFYSKYSSQWRRLTSIPLTSRFFFPLSRFHEIYLKKRKIRKRENAFFFYIIFKDLNGIANFYSSVCFTRMQINRFLIINYDNILFPISYSLQYLRIVRTINLYYQLSKNERKHNFEETYTCNK